MLETIKRLLEINDNVIDDKLNHIVELVSSRLKNLLGGVKEVPESLNYIVIEVSIVRFNRIGSEGTSSHSINGESIAWGDDDFAPFKNDIRDYLEALPDASSSGKGKVRFL